MTTKNQYLAPCYCIQPCMRTLPKFKIKSWVNEACSMSWIQNQISYQNRFGGAIESGCIVWDPDNGFCGTDKNKQINLCWVNLIQIQPTSTSIADSGSGSISSWYLSLDHHAGRPRRPCTGRLLVRAIWPSSFVYYFALNLTTKPTT